MNLRIAKTFAGGLEDLVYGFLRDEEGMVLYPDSATFTLSDGEVIINTPSGTMNIDADTGLVSYVWATSEATNLIADLPRNNIRVRWSITVGANTYERTQYIDILQVKLITDVHDADLIRRFNRLDNNRERFSSYATGGTTTTLIDTRALPVYEPNFFLGSFLYVVNGSNEGRVARITLFDAVDSTITFEPAMPYAIKENDTYEILYSYETQISEAYRHIDRYMRERLDYESLLLLSGMDFTDMHLALSLQYACQMHIRQPGDEFYLAAERFGKEYAAALSELQLRIDNGLSTDDDGDTDSLYEKKHYIVWGS